MAKLFFLPPIIIDGDPLVGGKVFTYIAATSTPKTTYTDEDESDALPNPVILDSLGSKAIWLKTDAKYKFIIKDSTEAFTYFTLDQVEGISSTIGGSPPLTSIIDGNGNTLISFSGAASSVNYFTLANAASGNNPTLGTASGTDSNVSMTISCQGTGSINTTSPLITTGTFSISGANYITSDISPSQITANQDNYNPTGLSTASVIRFTTDASRNLTGLAGGSDGRIITLVNVGSFDLVLQDDSASSTAGNRFYLYGAQQIIRPDSTLTLIYDLTSTRWRPLNNLYPANQAAMEAGTNDSAVVTATTLKYCPCAVKVWGKIDMGATIKSSYGVSSVTDEATGKWLFNTSLTFSSTDNVVPFCSSLTVANTFQTDYGHTQVASTTGARIELFNSAGSLAETDGTAAILVLGDY